MVWRDKQGGVEHNAQNVSTNNHLTTFSAEYTADAGGDIAAVAVITPSTGRKLAVESIEMATDGSSGSIQHDFVTSSIKILRMYPSKNTQSHGAGMHLVGGADESITFQATGIGNASKVFVLVNYVEHD